jgi:hypothetical protein
MSAEKAEFSSNFNISDDEHWDQFTLFLETKEAQLAADQLSFSEMDLLFMQAVTLSINTELTKLCQNDDSASVLDIEELLNVLESVQTLTGLGRDVSPSLNN